jgi:hypothetical protein
MSESATSSVATAIGAVASLIPYVGQVAALAPAVVTLTQFITDTIHNYHSQGEMTDEERAAFLQDVANLKQNPAWQTDAERAAAGNPRSDT